MERNYDEVISDMLIQLASIEASLKSQNTRMEAFDKRMDMTIRRMVKAETRIEQQEKRMQLFDKKLEQSIKNLREFSQTQNEMNRYFLSMIKNGKK